MVLSVTHPEIVNGCHHAAASIVASGFGYGGPELGTDQGHTDR